MAKKDKGEKAAKGPKPLRIATVVKPCLIGSALLIAVDAALAIAS